MRLDWLALCAGAVLLLAGCATLSETECRGADWYQLGERDGANGHSTSRLDAHTKACAEHAVAPDETQWREGYDAGLPSFCTAENGYRLGRRNGYYEQVCPLDLEREFVDAYDLGRETYEAESQLQALRTEAGRLESRLSDRQLSDEGRYYIRRELDRLYYEIARVRERLFALDNDWRRR